MGLLFGLVVNLSSSSRLSSERINQAYYTFKPGFELLQVLLE